MKTDRGRHDNQADPLPKAAGRDELNLAEFPIAAISHRVPDGSTELVFQDEIRDQATGDTLTRKLTVTGDGKRGLPTSLDEDVIVALMCVTKEANNFESRVVSFSRMAVIELLGWARNGQSLRRLDESLHRWLGVTLRYENAWWDKTAQTWVNESFHILDNLTIYDQQTIRRIKRNPAQTSLPLSTFAWNDVIFRSFQAENLKRLDLSTYFKLSLAPSKRAYRFLDKRFYRTSFLKFDLRSFACGKIGFSTDYSAAKIKEKLQPAIDELESVGFLAPLSREQRYEKVNRGQWEIVLERGRQDKRSDKAESTPPSALPSLTAALVERGVASDVAEELVSLQPSAVIEAKIEVFDWLMEKQDKKATQNPPGYLVASIRKDYAAPPRYVSKAERKRREEAKQQAELEKAEEYSRKQKDAARERDEDKAVKAYWQSLSPQEQAALDAKLEAEVDPAELTKQTGPFKELGRLIRRRDYIANVLKAEGKLAVTSA